MRAEKLLRETARETRTLPVEQEWICTHERADCGHWSWICRPAGGVGFAAKFPGTIGFDIDERRVAALTRRRRLDRRDLARGTQIGSTDLYA